MFKTNLSQKRLFIFKKTTEKIKNDFEFTKCAVCPPVIAWKQIRNNYLPYFYNFCYF